MKRITGLAITVLALAFLSSQSAYATARSWNSLGTDWNTDANWNGGAPTVANAVGQFTTVESVQPNLSASVSIAGIYFSGTATSGYDITNSAGATFTLNGTGATGLNGTANGSAAAIRSEITSGTNTVDAPIILGAAAASTQVLFQAAGGDLKVNGAISNTNAVTLDLKGTGTIELNGSNSSLSAAVRLNDAGTTLVVGNNNALGTGTFTVNASGVLQAGGAARTIANNIVFGATTTISGSNDITFTGNASTSGANSRTITVNNTGATNFNGTFTINGNASAGLVVNGTGNATINGSIVDGVPAGGTLSHGGTGTLSLTNSNTFSGGSLLSGGTTISTSNGAFGAGNVSLTANNVTLTLQGVTNSIADSAGLNIGLLGNTGDLVNLNFIGTETVNTLSINGTAEAAGVWGAPGSGAPNTDPTLAGTGTLTVLTQSAVPEPSTLAMIAIGAASLIGAQIRRKRS